MAGITDWPFRLLCRRMGADETVTEMISAPGLLSAPPGNRAYAFLLSAHPEEDALAAQIVGRDPASMAKAAARLQDTGRYIGIDVNFGCPAHKITASGGGAAIMRDVPLAAKIVDAVRRVTVLRLSAKMRIGWDKDNVNAVAFAKACEENGVDLLCVHGRTREQQYSGKADWDEIARVRQAVHIPVIANGDVFTARDALDILRHTGAHGVAVGRGALGNPFIFRQIKAALSGRENPAPENGERLSVMLSHMDDMIALKGEETAVVEMRKHLAWYLKGTRGAAAARARVNECKRAQEVRELLRAHFATLTD
jgi:tRNA-dihydrouridine synthase B